MTSKPVSGVRIKTDSYGKVRIEKRTRRLPAGQLKNAFAKANRQEAAWLSRSKPHFEPGSAT